MQFFADIDAVHIEIDTRMTSGSRKAAAEAQRAKETTDWERIHRMVAMAVSTNTNEAYVGMHLLKQSMADSNSNPDQRAFIRQRPVWHL
jgi:hypothetical protein